MTFEEREMYSAKLRQSYIEEMEALKVKLNQLKNGVVIDGKRCRRRSESEPGFASSNAKINKRTHELSPPLSRRHYRRSKPSCSFQRETRSVPPRMGRVQKQVGCQIKQTRLVSKLIRFSFHLLRLCIVYNVLISGKPAAILMTKWIRSRKGRPVSVARMFPAMMRLQGTRMVCSSFHCNFFRSISGLRWLFGREWGDVQRVEYAVSCREIFRIHLFKRESWGIGYCAFQVFTVFPSQSFFQRAAVRSIRHARFSRFYNFFFLYYSFLINFFL